MTDTNEEAPAATPRRKRWYHWLADALVVAVLVVVIAIVHGLLSGWGAGALLPLLNMIRDVR